MDRLRSLSVFARVADLGSFAAAARDLGISPAMVGNHIRGLEAWFSAPLLLRTTRMQTLTDTGHEVLALARDVLSGLAALDALAEHAVELSGPLRLTAPLGLGRHHVAPALRRFAREHPRLQIELRLSDLPEDMVKSGLDIAVRNGPLAGGEANLVARVIARQSLLLAASPDYLATAGAPQALGDLQEHKAIRYSRHGRPRSWLFPSEGDLIRVDSPVSFMADDLESLCDAACEGLGIVWLPDWLLAPRLADGSLVLVLPDQRPLSIDTYLIRSASMHPSKKVRQVTEFLAQAIPRSMTRHELAQSGPSKGS